MGLLLRGLCSGVAGAYLGLLLTRLSVLGPASSFTCGNLLFLPTVGDLNA